MSRPKKTLDKVIDEIRHVAELLDVPVHEDPVFEVVWIKEEVKTKGCADEKDNFGYISREMNEMDSDCLEITSPQVLPWPHNRNNDN